MTATKTRKSPKTASKVNDFSQPRDNVNRKSRGKCEGTRKPALEIALNRQISGVQ